MNLVHFSHTNLIFKSRRCSPTFSEYFKFKTTFQIRTDAQRRENNNVNYAYVYCTESANVIDFLEIVVNSPDLESPKNSLAVQDNWIQEKEKGGHN